MKTLIQKVKSAKLFINNEIIGEIINGYLIYLGIEMIDRNREKEILQKLLRIKFIDEKGKFKKSLIENKKPLMVIPNITLLAKINKSSKPEFIGISKDIAKEIYYNFLYEMENSKIEFISGIFGEEMIIESQNYGPINFLFNL